MKKILVIVWILVSLLAVGIGFVYWFFNSGITNEKSTFIDRAQEEAAKSDVQAELDKLLE